MPVGQLTLNNKCGNLSSKDDQLKPGLNLHASCTHTAGKVGIFFYKLWWNS